MVRKSLIVGAVVIVSAAVVWKFYPTKAVATVDQNDVVAVSTGSIQNRIDVVAKVALINKETVTFKQTGKISNVSVTEGTDVKQGQVLASVDTKPVMLDIASQQISLANSRIALAKIYESYGITEKMQSQNSAEESQRKLENLDLDLASLQREKDQTLASQDDQIAEAKSNLEVSQKKIESMKLDVEVAKRSEAESIAETQATGDSRIRTTQSNAQSLLTDLRDAGVTYKKLLSIDNQNDGNFILLGTTQLRSDASFQYAAFIDNQAKLSSALQNFDTKTATVEQAQSLASLCVTISGDSVRFSSVVKDLIEATLPSPSYSESSLSNYRTTISGYSSKFTGWINSANSNVRDLSSGSSVETIQLSTQSSLASKEASLASSQADILKQTNALNQLINGKTKYELDYEAKIRTKQLEIESAKSSIELAKRQYQDLLDGPKQTEIERAKNDIVQSENTLASLQEKIKDYQIIAPMDGKVTAIAIRTGKTSNTTDGITVENRDTIQLKSLVDQSQAVKILPGTTVKVTFDAYKQKTFDATVSFVESVPTESSGVVSYTVKFVMKKPEGVELYDAMTASAKILLDTVDNVVTIPLSAIQEDANGKFVQVFNRGALTKQKITVGKTDATNAEVKEGLTAGQRIVIRPYANQSTTAAKSGFSLFNLGGGQRGAGGGAGRTGGGQAGSQGAAAGGATRTSGASSTAGGPPAGP